MKYPAVDAQIGLTICAQNSFGCVC